MIIIADKVKNTMNNHSIQFFLEFSTIFKGILTNRIDTDEKVTRQLFTFTIIECYYICKIIMLKKLLIDV